MANEEREHDSDRIIDIVITNWPTRDRLVYRKVDERRLPTGIGAPPTGLNTKLNDGNFTFVGFHEWCTGTIFLKRTSAYGWALIWDGGCCNLRAPLNGRPRTYADIVRMFNNLQDKSSTDHLLSNDG